MHRHVGVVDCTSDERCGLVIAEYQHHQVVITVLDRVRRQVVDHILNRLAILLPNQRSVLPHIVYRRSGQGLFIEDGAVAHLIPAHQLGSWRPRCMRRNQCDFRHDRCPLILRAFVRLQCRHHILIRHRYPVERQAVVAGVVGVVHVVVAKVLGFRPHHADRRHDGERTPASALEQPIQGRALTHHQGVVTQLAVDPQTRHRSGMCQPADAAYC